MHFSLNLKILTPAEKYNIGKGISIAFTKIIMLIPSPGPCVHVDMVYVHPILYT